MKLRLFGAWAFRAVVVVAFAVIAVELGGIWAELRGVRREQVKNAVYSMRPDAIARIQASANAELRLRRLSGQSWVAADDTLPVEIQK